MLRVRDELAHGWDLSGDDARKLQERLSSLVVQRTLPTDGPGAPRLAAGVDVGYSRDGARAWGCAVTMDRSFRIVERTIVADAPDLPYETGLLAFREGRLSIEALTRLRNEPELVFCDGHGVVHERGLGLASHIGVLLDVPVIGVPKTPFHPVDRAPEPGRGSYVVYATEWGARGAGIRLRSGSKPVYVSPGYGVDLESAIALCLAWSTGRHRVPEPLQSADTLSKLARNECPPA